MPNTVIRKRRRRRVGGEPVEQMKSDIAGNIQPNEEENSQNTQYTQSNMYEPGSQSVIDDEYNPERQSILNKNEYEYKNQPQNGPPSFFERMSNGFKTAKIKLYNWLTNTPNQTGGRRRRHSSRRNNRKKTRRINKN